jgi:hypothetical protein
LKKSDTVLKAWLNQNTPEKREALLRFLPEEKRACLSELPSVQEKTEEIGFDSLLEKIHWSWFLPTLQTFPAKDQRLFLQVLDPYATEQLKSSLSLKGDVVGITETAKSFLKQKLLSSLDSPQEGLLPAEYLPPSPLNRLLGLSKQELIRLINSLALYDLAQEMRQIVETKTLKQVSSLLSEEQKNLLKKITIFKESQSLPKLGIEKWEGTKKSLEVLLHRRGLIRLGIAFAGQSPDLIWMICHQLDIGRGGTLFKLCNKEKKSAASDPIIRQIEELLSLL